MSKTLRRGDEKLSLLQSGYALTRPTFGLEQAVDKINHLRRVGSAKELCGKLGNRIVVEILRILSRNNHAEAVFACLGRQPHEALLARTRITSARQEIFRFVENKETRYACGTNRRMLFDPSKQRHGQLVNELLLSID